jgi:RNA polymerase sigma-B factor
MPISFAARSAPRRPFDPHASAYERSLLLRYHLEGDIAAREELVERFMPFVRDLALRYTYTDEPVDDLVQVGAVGLLKAIDRYEPGRGSKFTSYAAPTILGELKRHFRDRGWAVHVPRDLQERALTAGREREELTSRLGRSPTVRELAHALGWSTERVLEATEVASSYDAASLDAPVARGEEDAAPLLELIGGEDDRYALAESRQAIADGWRELSPIEQEVLRLRFTEDLTQREIGERVGYSQMHVSRLLRRALEQLDDARVAA